MKGELQVRIGPVGLMGDLGRGLCGGGRAKGRVVTSSPGCGDTKGPVCPSLAHALHSHTLSSLIEEGDWKEKGIPLGPEHGLPSLPASS